MVPVLVEDPLDLPLPNPDEEIPKAQAETEVNRVKIVPSAALTPIVVNPTTVQEIQDHRVNMTDMKAKGMAVTGMMTTKMKETTDPKVVTKAVKVEATAPKAVAAIGIKMNNMDKVPQVIVEVAAEAMAPKADLKVVADLIAKVGAKTNPVKEVVVKTTDPKADMDKKVMVEELGTEMKMNNHLDTVSKIKGDIKAVPKEAAVETMVLKEANGMNTKIPTVPMRTMNMKMMMNQLRTETMMK